MYSEPGLSLKDARIGAYTSWLNICQDGYSLSKTPVPGFDSSQVLARINRSQPLTSTDGSFKSEILKTLFNIGLKKTDEKHLWIVPNSIRHSKHGLLKKASGEFTAPELESAQSILHRRFAGLAKKDEKDILKFADKYGLLKRQPVHNLVFRDRNTGRQFQLGESLLWWKEEIEDLAACLELWDMISRKDKNLKDKVLWHRDGIVIRLGENHIPLITRANMNLMDRWRRGDAKGPALYYLHLEADRRLLKALTPRMPGYKNGEIVFCPDTLLAAIWLMFLCEINGRTRFIRCPGCGEYFDAPDPRARFCSTRCRMRHYRKRMARRSKRRRKVK
jgi:hypothetical protein